jgi:hypothetical protein
MRLLVTSCLVLASALAGVLAPSVARADEKAACVASYERTQTLRKQNKLRESREQALVCARDKCPKLVRTDCARWLQEVSSNIPSVVFVARDARGRDRSDVKVLLDGAVVEEKLGQEVMVDPGPHTLHAETPDVPPVDQDIVVRAGEKGRAVTISFPQPKKPEPPRTPAKVEPVRMTPSEGRPLPAIVPVLGVVGLAAVGGGAYLAIGGSGQLADLRRTCAPHCEPSDVDTLNLRYRIAAASVGVGVIALGAAIWLFVTRPSAPERSNAAAVRLTPSGVSLGL